MNNSYTFACGQGATKAMIHCIEDGTLLKEDCCIVNSTQKIFLMNIVMEV